MLNLNFQFFLIFYPVFLLFFLSILLLFYNYLQYVKNFLFSKLKNKKKTNFKNVAPITTNVLNFFLLFLSYIFFITKYNNFFLQTTLNVNFLKFSFFVFFILSLILIILNFLFTYFYNINYTINYNSFIGCFFISLIFCSMFTKNFFIFFFFLEMFGYVYYLQFLQVFEKLKTSKIKKFYFDAMLSYYWVNFFGTIFMLYSIIYLFYKFNTTNFLELNYFLYNDFFYFFYFFWIIGFSLKLGLAGFHFLKIEVYKNLKLDSIINFSFLSMFGYLILIKYIILHFFFFFNITLVFAFFFIFLLLFVTPTSLFINNVVLFFGFSTLLNTTLSLILIM